MRAESWRAWWAELSAVGRAQWRAVAGQSFLTPEQLRRLQYEGLLMAGEVHVVDGVRRTVTPRELRWLAGKT